jgi:hypothetical protein
MNIQVFVFAFQFIHLRNVAVRSVNPADILCATVAPKVGWRGAQKRTRVDMHKNSTHPEVANLDAMASLGACSANGLNVGMKMKSQRAYSVHENVICDHNGGGVRFAEFDRKRSVRGPKHLGVRR